MSNIFLKIKKQKGYALLFAVIIIGSISAVVSGLLSSTTKQLILSSLAQDSLIAFYQADIGMDCGLYAVLNDGSGIDLVNNGETWICGGETLTKNISGGNYSLVPEDSSDPCFEISKTTEDGGEKKISAKGYNICDKTNSRTVEREITANYIE